MKLIGILVFGIFFCIKGFGQSLVGTKWVLISIDRLETSKSKLIDKKFESNLTFNADSTYIGVTCNEYKGQFTSSFNKNIKLSAPTIRKLSCVWLDELEREVLAHLKTVNHFRIKEHNLFLFTTDGIRMTYGLKNS